MENKKSPKELYQGRVQQFISWQFQKRRSFRGRGLPLTKWSCIGNLKGHSFCHQQCKSKRPLTVTLLPAGSQSYRLSAVFGNAEGRSPKRNCLWITEIFLSEGKQLSTWAALLCRQKDEGCPHKPDARPCNTVVAFSQVFQIAAFTQLKRVKPVRRLTEKPLITLPAHAVKGCRY